METLDNNQKFWEEESRHGGDIYTAAARLGINSQELVDFSANIVPFGLAADIKAAVIAALELSRHYPDPHQRLLKEALAADLQLAANQIVCGNGAADLIFRAVKAIEPQRAYLAVPTFLEYERALLENACQVNRFYLTPENSFELEEDFLAWLSQKIEQNEKKKQMVFLCQPNNPTGLLIKPPLLTRIVDLCYSKGVYLLIDECFLDFLSVEDSKRHSCLKSLSDKSELILVLRSMTKYHAIPGLRIGFLCSCPSIVQKVQLIGQPWPLNNLAEAAALAALQRSQEDKLRYQERVLIWLKQEKPKLGQALAASGCLVWPSSVNFLFFQVAKGMLLAEHLLSYGILLRNCGNYPGLNRQFFRIAVLNPAENNFLLEKLQEFAHKS